MRGLARGLLTVLLLAACATPPAAWPTPTSAAPTRAPIPAATTLAKSTPPPTATPAPLRVANTGGDGANLRNAPGTGKVAVTLPDGAVLAVVGPDQQADVKTWRNVRDGAGHAGWIVADYLAARSAAPSPTRRPAARGTR